MEGHYGAPRHRDDTPSNAFQHVCRVMLDGTSKEDLTKQKIEDFRVILHMIMHECSKANIETGKSWVFEYCHSPSHTYALMDYILSLAKTKSSQQEKVHLVYLVNDILFHSSRKQILWMKDSMLPMLVPLLRLAYDADSEEYKAKMIKMISFWGEKNIFDGNVITRIRQAVTQPIVDLSQQSLQPQSTPHHPPPPIPQIPTVHSFPLPIPQQQQVYHQTFPQPPFQQQQQQQQQQPPPPLLQQYQQPQRQQPLPQHPPPPRPYFELPAGLMTLVKCEDYQALDPNSIKLPFPKPKSSKTMLDTLDDFYNGLDLTSPSEDHILVVERPESTKVDSQGWEKGYLDFHFQSIQQKKKDKLEKRNLENRRRDDSSRQRSSDHRSYSREERYGRHGGGSGGGGHNRSRSSYSRSRSRSPSYRRRRSFSSSRSHSRGRSHSPRERGHSSKSGGGGGGGSPRGRSSPRDRSPRGRSNPRDRSPRGRSPPTQRGNYRYQRHYSRSRSPVYSQSSSTSSMKKPSFRNSTAQAPSAAASVQAQTPLKRLVNAPVGEVTVENKYLGLGNTLDEYDSFRRNKSQAFNRREPPQPITCFKCNRVGHLARDCDSL